MKAIQVEEYGGRDALSVVDRDVPEPGDGGGYAEYAIADAAGLFDVPEGLSSEEAAGFPVQFLTAHNCLHEWGGIEEGESVLIHAAAGGVGTAAVQIAREAGAEVFICARTQSQRSDPSLNRSNHRLK